jgi:hypothetical protein
MAGTPKHADPRPRGRGPGFTAEAAAGRAARSYRHRTGRGPRPANAAVLPAVSAVTGYYAGIYCVGGTQCVILEDFDENGALVNWHCADEIGSC